MGWTFGARKRVKIGPVYAWFSMRGFALPKFSSWGLKAGRFSRNMTRETTHIDTPGPGGFTHRPKGKGR